MVVFPKRQTLAAQATDYLKNQLAQGAWKAWLPNERALCESLHVSRGTLRAALRQLAAGGLVRSEPGRGNRILAAPRPVRKGRDQRVIGLLSPSPLEHLRPTQTLWIDELRVLLGEQAHKFQVVHGQHYFRGDPGTALAKLVRQHPHTCWILIRSGHNTQSWFQENGHPCVIAGSASPGIELPFVDIDHYALCHHAAGVFLGFKHRHVAFVSERTGRAGETASESGFVEGMRHSHHPEADPVILYHENTVESLRNALRRLMSLKRRPTGLLVANPHFYLTLSSTLAQMELRVPEHVSVISRDDDPFLSFLVPRPARYVISPHIFARKLILPLLEYSDGRVPVIRATKIMPQFVGGGSLQPLGEAAKA